MKAKKILVTGADGFIGSYLVETLIDRGFNVRAMTFYNSFNSWGWLEALSSPKTTKIEIFPGDIRDPRGVETAVKGCNIVFHLAALIAIPFSYHSPDSYVDTNIKGTLNVLQAARRFEVEKLLVTSTSEVYGTAKYVPIDERHPYQGQSPYSATKIAADRLSEAFHRSFNLPVVTVRPFNTYGPRQSARAVIPTIITQLLSKARTISLGNLNSTRDFNYVKDVVSAFIAIAESPKTVGEEINIATSHSISIEKLAQLLMKMLNKQARICIDMNRLRPDKSEVEQLVGCNKKIMELTNWRPRYDLETGLKETIEWFKKSGNLAKYKANLYNI